MKHNRRQFIVTMAAAAAYGTIPKEVLADAAGKTLIVGIAADPTGFDPEADNNNTSGLVDAAIYDRLVNYKPGTAEVAPGLAQSWDVSDDGLTYTFHLRPNVTFHDGTPLNAETYVQTISRLLDKSSPISIFNTGTVEGFIDFTYGGVESYKATGPNDVEFKLKQPSATFLSNLAIVFNGVVSPVAAGKYGKDFRNHPVGTGPFIFREWRPNDQVILEANPNYWNGAPMVAKLIYKVLPNAQAALLALKRGDIHLLLDVGAATIPALKADSSITVMAEPGLAISGVALPCDVKPFDDPRVRRALNLAIDKEAINKSLYKGLAAAMTSCLPPDQWGFNATLKGYGYDPEQAKKLLTEAGVQPGLKVELLTYGSARGYNPAGPDLAVAIQGYLKKIGIEASVRSMEVGAFLSEVRSGTYNGLRMAGFGTDNGDPDDFIGNLFYSKQIPIENTSHYKNEEVDKLIEQAASTTDHDKRVSLYQEIQKKVMDDAPWIFVNSVFQVRARRNEVSGFTMSPMQMPFDMEKVSLEG